MATTMICLSLSLMSQTWLSSSIKAPTLHLNRGAPVSRTLIYLKKNLMKMSQRGLEKIASHNAFQPSALTAIRTGTRR